MSEQPDFEYIAKLAKQYFDLKEEIEFMQQDLEELREDLLNAVEADQELLLRNGLVVSHEVYTNTYFDKKALQAQFPKAVKRFSTPRQYHRLIVRSLDE